MAFNIWPTPLSRSPHGDGAEAHRLWFSTNIQYPCTVHLECIHSALLFPHLLCYSLIPKWIKFIILHKILKTKPNNDNVKDVCLKSFETKKNHMYISIHSLCHDTQNWAQVHPVSTDHPWDVSTSWLESTCGKFSWLDMIWKAHTCLYKVPQVTLHVRAQTKSWSIRNCL